MSKLSGEGPGWPWRDKNGRFIDPDFPVVTDQQRAIVLQSFKDAMPVWNENNKHPYLIIGTMSDLEANTDDFKKFWTEPETDKPRLFIPFYKSKSENDEHSDTGI